MQVVENFCSFILPICLLSVHGTFFFCLGIFYEKKKQSGEYKKMTPLEEQRLKKEAGYHKMNQCRDCAYYSRRGSYLSHARKENSVKSVEMKLGITGAPVADVNVSMEINLAAMLEDPERSFPAVAKRLGEHLLEAFRLANPDMPENDTD